TTEDGSEPADASSGTTAATRRTRTPLDPARRRKLTVAFAALAVVLLVVTGLATWQYLEARDATAAEEEIRSEEHTSELQSRFDIVCRLLLEKKNKKEY